MSTTETSKFPSHKNKTLWGTTIDISHNRLSPRLFSLTRVFNTLCNFGSRNRAFQLQNLVILDRINWRHHRVTWFWITGSDVVLRYLHIRFTCVRSFSFWSEANDFWMIPLYLCHHCYSLFCGSEYLNDLVRSFSDNRLTFSSQKELWEILGVRFETLE